MKPLIWSLAALALVLGTLMTWAAHLLLVHGSGWVAANVQLLGAFPEWQRWLELGIDLGSQVGAAALWVLWLTWGGTALVIIVGAWLLARYLPQAAARIRGGTSGQLLDRNSGP